MSDPFTIRIFVPDGDPEGEPRRCSSDRPHELDGIRHRFSALQMDGGPAAFRVQSSRCLHSGWVSRRRSPHYLHGASRTVCEIVLRTTTKTKIFGIGDYLCLEQWGPQSCPCHLVRACFGGPRDRNGLLSAGQRECTSSSSCRASGF